MEKQNGVLTKVTEEDLELLKNNPEKFWEGVRDIGYFAFKNLKGLKELVIPSTVSRVYDVAVANCPNLKSVIISKGVKKIYNTAFNGNGNLESIIVEEGNENYLSSGNCLIETKTKTLLLGCKNSIIPADGSVTKIGVDYEWTSEDCCCGFYNTDGLKRIEIPEGITFIGYLAFSRNKDLISITIPESVTTIGAWAFSDCSSLTSITIPKSVTTIEKHTFSHCSSLTSITIPESVTTIGASAFSDCRSLTSITIPESVRTIGEYAFSYCRSLTSITIPKSVTKIGDYVFSDCRSLTSITIPESVRTIGEYAFSNCSSLTSITIPGSVTTIGNGVFFNCRSLTSITIPESVTTIGNGAFFDCSSLTSITIPKSVTKIGNYVFSGCKNLTSITFPGSLELTSPTIFEGCIKLNHIKYGDLEFNKNEEGVWEVNYLGKVLKFKGADDKDFYGKLIFIKKAYDNKTNLSFVPHSTTCKNIKLEDLKYFFENSKVFAALQKEFAEKNNVSVENLEIEAREDFFKLCYISGLFSQNMQERKRAETFIKEKIIYGYTQKELHERFSGLETLEKGYNPKFAEFLIENYSPTFLYKNLSHEDEKHITNYLSQAYSNFDIILKAYPNAEIKTNTNRDRLTEKQVINFLRRIKYENVGEKKYPELTEAISERCIKLAEVVGYYGYSQEQFEKLQNWFIQGIKQGSNIVCGSDSEENEITFELLAKDNPLGAVLGNITNCCQRAGDAAESCVRHGMSDPNGGFVVFRKGKRIIGQAWVWYNEEMEKICYDNIEVPNSAKRLVRENSEEFVSCLKRASLSMVESMSKKGKKVSTVTMGKGYNDLLNLIKNKAEEFEKESERLGGAPANYSDTRPGEVRVLGALVTAAILSAACQQKKHEAAPYQ